MIEKKKKKSTKWKSLEYTLFCKLLMYYKIFFDNFYSSEFNIISAYDKQFWK